MKALVIDDDKFIRNVFASELEQENVSVEVAVNGIEGLEKAKELRPDIIILDMILPKKDGFELLKEFQKIPELKHTAIYAFSGLSQEHDKAEALELGVKEYFNKNDHTIHRVIDAIRVHANK